MLTRTLHSFVHRQLWSVGLLLLCLVPLASSMDLNWNVIISDLDGIPRDHRDFSRSANRRFSRTPAVCSSCHARLGPDTYSNLSGNNVTHAKPEDGRDAERSVALAFQSTAIHVYCVSPNAVACPNTPMNITFSLDGAAVGSYRGKESRSEEYNITVYHNASLQDEAHKLVLTAGQGTPDSIRLYDQPMHHWHRNGTSNATLTTSPTRFQGVTSTTTPKLTQGSLSPSPTPELTQASMSPSPTSSHNADWPPHHHSNVAIVAGVVGGIIGLIVVTLLSLCIRRHQLLLRQPLLHDRDSLDSKRKAPLIEPFMEFRYSNGAPHPGRGPPPHLPHKGRLGTAAPSWRWPASTTAYSTEPGPSIEPPSTVSSGGMTHREALAQQVREMREEIRRLRDLALRLPKTGHPQ